MAPRILLAGGGTGGHAIPALAIAEAIQKKHEKSEFLFVGTERGVEARVVPKAGFALELISVISLSRSLNASLLRFPFVLLKGFVESLMVVRRFKPHLTVCTGGYVSGPVGVAAALSGVPLAIHDSNVWPGITLRLLSRVAALVMLGFDEAHRKMGGCSIRTVGNPTRFATSNVDPGVARAAFGLAANKRTLLIVGGSQGARSINQAVACSLSRLVDQQIQLLWQTGPVDHDRMSDVAKPYGEAVRTVAFIDEMPSAYRAADLAITRAGAMTITELNLYGVPAILVPLATASENHQELNARVMVDEGWARMILQKDIDGDSLWAEVEMLLQSRSLKEMAAKSLARGTGDAADRIANELIEHYLLRI